MYLFEHISGHLVWVPTKSKSLSLEDWGVDGSVLKYRITEFHVKGIVTIISILPLMLKYIMNLIES